MFIIPFTSDQCNVNIPYFICLANYKCAYIRKYKHFDGKDFLPRYLDPGSSNMCVSKVDFPNGLEAFPKEYE